MRLFVLLVVLLGHRFALAQSDFVARFDAQKDLGKAVTLLVDELAINGNASIAGVASTSPIPVTLDDFASGLKSFRLASGRGYANARAEMKVTPVIGSLPVDQGWLDFLDRYYSKRPDLGKEVVSYLRNAKDVEIAEVIISPPDGKVWHWYLFFRQKDGHRRLEQAVLNVIAPAITGWGFLVHCRLKSSDRVSSKKQKRTNSAESLRFYLRLFEEFGFGIEPEAPKD